MMKKINKRMRINKKFLFSVLIGLVVLIIAIIVIFNLFFVNKELNSLKIKNESIYIYFGEGKFKYTGNITLDHDNNITNVKLNNKKTTLYSEPIYYSKKDKIILPVNYSIIFPLSSGKQNKINYFTTLEKIDDDYYLNGNELNFNMTNDFLYDGKDYYIFVNDATVIFNGNNINITPMSYVNYVYDTKQLFIYNYSEDKVYYYENVLGDVIVTSNNYKVNLSSDTIEVNGKNKLLMKNFDYLKKLK